MQATQTSYDDIPYPAGIYRQSHPDRLEALATLFGLTPKDTRACRVLELGCANGSNLIPMAVAQPGSSFVGVDLSSRQIEAGRAWVSGLGLSNIELRQADLRAVDHRFGEFDYIIAHGVFSWVPADAQEKILSICRENLSPTGVAYVSYNTYPGWRMRGLLRDMMLYHAAKFDRPEQQIEQARALIQWLAETVPADKSPYGQLLQSELEQMKTWQDTYFRHDSLEEINEPIYFHQFVRRAERHGLQYLAEAELPTMLPGNYGAPVSETLNRLGRDIIELEQYLDFVRNRMFRQTLLCRRSVRLNRALGPWSLQPFHLASALKPAGPAPDLNTDEPEEFKGPHSMTATTNQPLAKAALMELADAWPEVVAFEDLLCRVRSRLDPANARQQIPLDQDREVLGGVLIQCVSQGVCELLVHSPPFVVNPGPTPCACPWARFRAAQGQPVANRRHEIVPLDNFRKRLLPLLDGRQTREALLEQLIGMVGSGDLEVKVNDTPVCDASILRKVLPPELEKALREFGASALLVG